MLMIISLPKWQWPAASLRLKFQEPDGSRCIGSGFKQSPAETVAVSNITCRNSRNVRTLWNHQNEIPSLINNYFMLLRTNWQKLTNYKFHLFNVFILRMKCNFDKCIMFLNEAHKNYLRTEQNDAEN
jgi:hypothetical protein